jgi:hypothetical protein
MKWNEILSNKSQFPDDFVVSVKVNGKDESLSLGDMRAYDVESKGALSADLTRREQELTTREKNVNAASLQIGTVVEKVATAAGLTVEELLQGKAPTKRAVAAAVSDDLDENDPLVGRLVKEIKGLQTKLDKQSGDVEALRKNALGPMLNTYLEDYYESKWEKLSTSLPKGSKVTRDEALKYASDNKLVDAKGRLDLSKAARDLTYDDRVKADAAAMAADLRKKDDDARVLAAAPRPSSLGQRTKPDKSLLNEKGRVKDFDEVLNDALADTDLWRGVQNVQ